MRDRNILKSIFWNLVALPINLLAIPVILIKLIGYRADERAKRLNDKLTVLQRSKKRR